VVFRLRFAARPGGADPRSFRLRLRPGLVTTDTAAQVIERVRKQMDHRDRDRSCQAGLGTGQARNRTARALRRTVSFQLACQSIAITWYATAGHDLPT